MNTTSIGNLAESRVVSYLESEHYKILARNWKKPICEIDIIAKKDGTVYFIEVKYRSRPDQGSGLEYITPKKLKQLKFAAEVWAKENDWNGDYTLLAASVRSDGIDQVIEDILEIV